MNRFYLFLFLLPTYASGWLLDQLDHHCGVEHVHRLDAALDQARMKRFIDSSTIRRRMKKLTCDELCVGCITIDTVFHLMTLNFRGTQVLPHPSSAVQRFDQGDTTLTVASFTSVDAMRQILRNQIAVTNEALAGSPFQLRFDEDALSLTQNNNYMRYPIDFTTEMSDTIGSGDLRILDVYLSYTVLRQSEAANPPLRVGTTFLPSQQLVRKSDGMYLRYDTLTGGGLNGIDRGVTLTHELGHWLGLYHTFRTDDGSEFGCEDYPNDFIDDTPAHLGDSLIFDCRDYLPSNFLAQPLPDTCPTIPGSDPVFNYMNYVSLDDCHIEAGEFTCNQIERMYYQWVFYRETVDSCPPGEMELEFAYEFDRDHDEDNQVFIYELIGDQRGPVIFDSNVDHDQGAFQLQDILAVDICLPVDSTYEFVIMDRTGNGFSRGGTVAVYLDGQLIASASGNFGSEYSVVVAALTPAPVAPPTQVPTTSTPTESPVAQIVATDLPTGSPTASPTTDAPTGSPMAAIAPTNSPTESRTMSPIASTDSPVAKPITTQQPSEILELRTSTPTSSGNETVTAVPTSYLRTEPPRLPTRPPHPVKMMKSKMSQPMKKLGKSYDSPSKSMKSSKTSTKKSKKMKSSEKSKLMTMFSAKGKGSSQRTNAPSTEKSVAPTTQPSTSTKRISLWP